jgi:ABC-type lipoprotein release transport system permease subunit
MLFQIAWRNVLRARRRTIITLTLSTISTAFFIFYVAMMDGSYAKIFKDSVEIYPGYIQITQDEYRNDPGYEHLIFDAERVEAAIKTTPGISLFAERFEGFALYASDENSIGGMFAGIDPVKEKSLSRVYKAMKEGKYLEAGDTNRLLIGSDFAKRLGVKIGDTVSIITNATDYSFTADNLVVKGIFQTHLHDFDASAAFVTKSYFDQLMVSNNMATHIIVLPADPATSPEIAKALRQKLDGTEYEVQEWHQYMKEIIEAMEFDRFNGIIMMWLFLIIILFVIMIYALLTIFARTKEIGIMRAIGTTPLQIFYILMLETLILGVISVLLGGAIGGWLAYYFELHPIHMEQFEEAYRQYGIVEAVLPTDFSWGVVFRGMGYMLLLNLLCALYPVWRVNRFSPVDAIRHI